jgi:hypothetical protein
MESSCLFCLEVIREAFPPNPIGCSCKIQAHKHCFDAWFVQKNQMECPICHTIATPNQIHDTIHIVYIDTTEVQPRHHQENQQKKAAVFCCLLLMGWSIGMTIIDVVSRS